MPTPVIQWLNNATDQELDALEPAPGVGSRTIAHLKKLRGASNNFRNLDDVEQALGIGPVRLGQLVDAVKAVIAGPPIPDDGPEPKEPVTVEVRDGKIVNAETGEPVE